MGICTARNILLTTCALQLLTTVERQVFEFLGYMWAPILVNFFEIIFVIFGLFGGVLYRYIYLISYCLWNVFCIAWNIFVICFYLDVGTLDKTSDILNLGTGSFSWWLENGYKCRPYFSPNTTREDIYRPVRPEFVTGCFLEYPYVEVIHALIQVILAIIAVIVAGILCRQIQWNAKSEGNGSSMGVSRKSKKNTSLYSIELSYEHEEPRGYNDSDTLDSDVNTVTLHTLKPMTPRRVKRRSIMTRGHPTGGGSIRSRSSGSRSSGRRSNRNSHPSCNRQNPVTQLIEQQQWKRNAHTNPMYEHSSIQSLTEQLDFDVCNNRPASARSNYSNFHGMRHLGNAINSYYPSTDGGAVNTAMIRQATNNQPAAQTATKNSHFSRQSLRSKIFLNSGPPAYTPNTSTAFIHDSETTI